MIISSILGVLLYIHGVIITTPLFANDDKKAGGFFSSTAFELFVRLLIIPLITFGCWYYRPESMLTGVMTYSLLTYLRIPSMCLGADTRSRTRVPDFFSINSTAFNTFGLVIGFGAFYTIGQYFGFKVEPVTIVSILGAKSDWYMLAFMPMAIIGLWQSSYPPLRIFSFGYFAFRLASHVIHGGVWYSKRSQAELPEYPSVWPIAGSNQGIHYIIQLTLTAGILFAALLKV